MKSETLFSGLVEYRGELLLIDVYKEDYGEEVYYTVYKSGDMDDSEDWNKQSFEAEYGTKFYDSLEDYVNNTWQHLNDWWPDE